MRDPLDVITTAVNGCTKELAAEYEVSLPRMYEILSKDSPYPKAKRLIRKIARVNPDGIAIIKADIDALFADLVCHEDVSDADLSREAFEAIQAALERKPRAIQAKELRELIVKAECRLATLDAETDKVREAAREGMVERLYPKTTQGESANAVIDAETPYGHGEAN